MLRQDVLDPVHLRPQAPKELQILSTFIAEGLRPARGWAGIWEGIFKLPNCRQISLTRLDPLLKLREVVRLRSRQSAGHFEQLVLDIIFVCHMYIDTTNGGI